MALELEVISLICSKAMPPKALVHLKERIAENGGQFLSGPPVEGKTTILLYHPDQALNHTKRYRRGDKPRVHPAYLNRLHGGKCNR